MGFAWRWSNDRSADVCLVREINVYRAIRRNLVLDIADGCAPGGGVDEQRVTILACAVRETGTGTSEKRKGDGEVNVLRGWWWNGKRALAMLDAVKSSKAAGPTPLRVDVDHQRKLSVAELAARLKKNNRKLAWVIEQRSPSGRGWHRWIGVWPRPATAVETVALQLLCGSDPHREAYNLNRARQVDAGQVSDYWRARWNVFYKCESERERKGKRG